MDQEKIGKFILNLRKQRNLTQKEFADRLNVTAQAVSKWENGRGLPDIEILQKISTEFHINIDNILTATTPKNGKKIKIIVIISILIILLVILIYLFLKPSSYNFTDIESTNEQFNVSGVAVYSSDQNSIYISDIEYLDGSEDEKYVGMECILYESHDNLEEKVSQCGSIKNKQDPKTLSELLKETQFKVQNFTCTNSSIKNSKLYIDINLRDINDNIITYKVPLQLTGTCN